MMLFSEAEINQEIKAETVFIVMEECVNVVEGPTTEIIVLYLGKMPEVGQRKSFQGSM